MYCHVLDEGFWFFHLSRDLGLYDGGHTESLVQDMRYLAVLQINTTKLD